MTREQLFDAMIHCRSILYKSRWIKIESMQIEDGSGYCFNLGICYDDYHRERIFYRCPRPATTLAVTGQPLPT